jgi:hypothetical protein
MNSSFLATLTAVLSGQDKIENLPQDKLIATNHMGDPIQHIVPVSVFLKLARLQTLAFQAYEKSEMPSYGTVKSVVEVTGGNTAQTMANSLEIQEDAARRITMIERLIVEVVREAIPAECEQNDVEYFAHVSGVIMRRPSNNRRILD